MFAELDWDPSSLSWEIGTTQGDANQNDECEEKDDSDDDDVIPVDDVPREAATPAPRPDDLPFRNPRTIGPLLWFLPVPVE